MKRTTTIVTVTYGDRLGYLQQLIERALAFAAIERVLVVSNAATAALDTLRERWPEQVELIELPHNSGSANGYAVGIEAALQRGAEYIWMMDDDVEVLPDGLAKMGKWAPRFKSIQGRRYDYDGSEFYWQYRLSIPLGIPIPFAPAGFDDSRYRVMNSGCFEGMFIHRDIVAKIGLPDPRFFIYWDDSVYGWLASRETTAVIVDEFVLRRTREIKQWDMGIRHLNASSNAYRYYIMRNRGHMQHYFKTHGEHKPVRFALGSALTFGKELVRLAFVERTIRGTSNLRRGVKDGRALARDASWQPMPPLQPID